MYKYILSMVFFASLSAADMIAWKSNNNTTVLTNGRRFSVKDDCGMYEVQSCFVDSKLRDKSLSCLSAMKNCGYLNVVKLDRATYKIDFKERALGGGPVAGAIAYWVVKVGLWGGIVGATTTTVVATGGAAAGAFATGLASAGVATGTVAATTAISVGAAAGVAGTAAVVASAGTGLMVTTAAVTTAATTSVGVVGSIEAASVGAAAIFTAIPFLP